jgi:uncharacterized protein (DUF924 family)
MTTPADVLGFWFTDGPDTFRDAWFRRDDAFDAAIRDRFAVATRAAREGALDGWAAQPDSALALLVLLDQFPRNLHRGGAEAFASDAHARAIARDVVLAHRFDLALAHTERVFLYLPFEHSEAMADQDVSVALFEGLRDDARMAKADGTIDYAWRHRAVVARFGRFPHRNAVLGRESTAAEAAWVAAGGGF